MNKKINKENKDSEELFKHLDNSNGNTDGLDDFEKEALEGFASLDSSSDFFRTSLTARELAKKTNDELTKKIEDKYFKEEGEKSPFLIINKEKENSKKPLIYWSMAAGLALVIGLSVFFFNNATKKDSSNLAYSEKPEETTQKLNEEVFKQSPSAVTNEDKSQNELKNETSQSGESKVGEKVASGKKSANDADAEFKSPTDVAKTRVTNGPVTTAPVSIAEQKPGNVGLVTGGAGEGGKDGYLAQNEKKADEKDKDKGNYRDDAVSDIVKEEKVVMQSQSPRSADKREETKAKKSLEKQGGDRAKTEQPKADGAAIRMETESNNNLALHSNTKNKIETNNPEPKSPAKESSESTTLDRNGDETDAKTVEKNVALKGEATTVNASIGMPMRKSSFFRTAKFSNHNDYFKTEIDKNETLKANLLKFNSAFRIDLIIDEKGKVTKVTADISEKNCSDCKKEMEKLILNMPFWEPAESANGKTVSQTFYFNYQYK